MISMTLLPLPQHGPCCELLVDPRDAKTLQRHTERKQEKQNTNNDSKKDPMMRMLSVPKIQLGIPQNCLQAATVRKTSVPGALPLSPVQWKLFPAAIDRQCEGSEDQPMSLFTGVSWYYSWETLKTLGFLSSPRVSFTSSRMNLCSPPWMVEHLLPSRLISNPNVVY